MNQPVMSLVRNLSLRYEEKEFLLAMDTCDFKKVSDTDGVVIGSSVENLHDINECVKRDRVFNLIKIVVFTAIDHSIDYCK